MALSLASKHQFIQPLHITWIRRNPKTNLSWHDLCLAILKDGPTMPAGLHMIQSFQNKPFRATAIYRLGGGCDYKGELCTVTKYWYWWLIKKWFNWKPDYYQYIGHTYFLQTLTNTTLHVWIPSSSSYKDTVNYLMVVDKNSHWYFCTLQ